MIHPYDRGFALLEVLISLFIISLGLLGIASLEILAVRAAEEAYWQSVATVQLASCFEQLRANTAASARTRELNDCQHGAQTLLPNAQISPSCTNRLCRISLTWRARLSHSLTWQAEV